MMKYDIVKILKENGVITTKELNELGFGSHAISKLVDSEFITRKERGIYTYGSINVLLDYGNELLESKDKTNSKLVFDFCYDVAPSNYDVNVIELYLSILLGNKEEVFKYFNFIYSTLKENDRMSDAYYYLFLYSYCYDVPDRYLIDYNHFLKGDFRRNDSDKSDIRQSVYTIDFSLAKKLIDDGEVSFDNSYESFLEKVLIHNAYNVYHYRNNFVNQCINNGNYSKAKNYLENRDEKEFLSYSQKSLLHIIKEYIRVSKSGNIPIKSDVSDENNFYLCIENNQFSLAKKILDNYYKNREDDCKNNTFYLVLDKFDQLIDSIEFEKKKKELLKLDNIISMIADGDYSLVEEYLKYIGKEDYIFLINDFIKLGELNNNNLFVITTLISISTGDYKFNINNFVSLYMKALEKKDYDRAKIFLDIISNSNHLSSIDIENSMMKIFNATFSDNNIDNKDVNDNKVVDDTDFEDNELEQNNTQDDYSIENKNSSFENNIRSMLDNLSENNPLCLLPTVSGKDEMDEIFNIIENDYPNICAFVINTSDGSQAVARYKIKSDGFVDFKELYASAKSDYIAHKYNDALPKFTKLLTLGNPHPAVYGMYGLCLRNMGKKDLAIMSLTIATEYSKLKGGDLDFSGVIFDMTHYGYNYSESENKPYVDVSDYNPDDTTFGRDLTFIDDLIALVKDGDIDFSSSLEQLNLSEEDKNYARLIYARDCYYVSLFDLGDKYLNMVEKSNAKNSDIISLIDELRKNKKFYQNRLDEERKRLVLIK